MGREYTLDESLIRTRNACTRRVNLASSVHDGMFLGGGRRLKDLEEECGRICVKLQTGNNLVFPVISGLQTETYNPRFDMDEVFFVLSPVSALYNGQRRICTVTLLIRDTF